MHHNWFRVRLGVYKGMEWNWMDLVGNGMEWNLKILFGCYKINKWNVSNIVWEQYEGNEIESFYNNITVRSLF